MNLFEAIFNQTSLDRTAILYEQRRISYAELRDETLWVAQALRELGVSPGERVVLLLNDSPEFVAAFIAICSYGAIAVPINMALRLEEQRAILNDCTATVTIAEVDISKLILADAPNKLPHLKQIVVVGREEAEGFTTEDSKGPGDEADEESDEAVKVWSFWKLMRQAQVADADNRAPQRAGRVGDVAMSASPGTESQAPFPETTFAQPGENQPAFILYTSGSTGEPKGAVHRQPDIFYTNETYCREVLRLRAADRLFSSSRLPFAYGLGNGFSFPLLNGCTTILCREKPSPEVVARVFADYKPTIFFAVPVVYRMLLESHQNTSSFECSSLRLCISAGEALPASIGEDWEKTFGVPVLDGIGSTEMLHMWMSNHEGEVVYGSSGKLLEGYEARLLDPEGRPTPAGMEGNLWVRGTSAAIGYWQRPKTTAGTFVDGWVRTGDLYRQDTHGFWYHMGRSDDCFKSSGQWVSPVEVEGVLQQHRGVSRVAVVEDVDGAGLPCACAFVVRTDEACDDLDLEQALRELARAAMPRHKQPRRYVFVNELPYTATGKIQRFRLRERLRAVQSPTSNVQSLSSGSNE